MKVVKILVTISSVLFLINFSACKKDTFDYADYETRVEYFENIREVEFLNTNELTIATWNIALSFAQADGGNPWSKNSIGGKPEHLDSIAQLLLSIDPDVILLQEVPLDRENTIVKKVLDEIALKMNYNYAFGGHGFNSDGTYPTRAQWGNAILSKFNIEKIENKEVYNLNDIWTRRSVLKATLKIKNGEYINAYSLHYNAGIPSIDSFLTQVFKTRDFYEEEQLPIILGGDFNISSDFTDTILNLTNCKPINFYSIDRIYVSDEFNILEFYHENEKSIKLSDHFTGIVKIEIN
jgi:endonuclease/exonuclease/phosphatase family metal-dependent hydrolase